MAHRPETVAAVRSSYVFDKLPLPAAATKHKVSIGTARRWKSDAKKQGDDWDKARASVSMTASNFEEIMAAMTNDFVVLHQSLVSAITQDADMGAAAKVGALNSLADSFSKFIAAAGKASPKLNKLSFAMEIIQALGAFITDAHPEHAPAFAEIIEPFGRELSKRYG